MRVDARTWMLWASETNGDGPEAAARGLFKLVEHGA
jgi:hypothetical protein